MIWISEADARTHKFDQKADLIFCDANQSIGKFNARSLIEDGDFTYFTRRWVRNCLKYLNDDGIFIFTALPRYSYDFERVVRAEGSVNYRETVVWHYRFGTYVRSKFVTSHLNIFIYQRGKPLFDWRQVAVPSQRQQAGDDRADARGRTPGTVWEHSGSVWDIPRMSGNKKQRTSDSPQLPFKLVKRLIKGFIPRRVIDVMTGSGTVPIVCKHLGIHCEAIDIDPYAVQRAKKRVEEFDKDLFI
jgi:DNA modification methylase